MLKQLFSALKRKYQFCHQILTLSVPLLIIENNLSLPVEGGNHMEDLTLTLRQRKLLHYLQHQSDYVTGQALAAHLSVSSRTIRTDVTEINELLSEKGIHIYSKRSSGYLLRAEDENELKKLSQTNSSFLSRDERSRHIAFRLCLSDQPINLYDLEDEMFISRTTLEHDIQYLRKIYILPSPHIKFYRNKNTIFFEKDERKRRRILNRLFAQDWNYNARGNAYYQYQYLDERVVNLIMSEVNYYMGRYNIMLEDINMVTLNLIIAIMYYRISSGHELTEPSQTVLRDPVSVKAADNLLDSLEGKLSCIFSDIEREEVYTHISCSRMLDVERLNLSAVPTVFQKEIIQLADTYIANINNTYGIDFSENEDFYITLLQYLRYLSLPVHYFNNAQIQSDSVRSGLLIELEIAFSFQPLSLDFYGSYLDYTELLYLAFCISGAMAYKRRTDSRLRTVILCHLNLSASWNLKHQILNKFRDYIDLTALLPVYIKDSYDFSQVDLVITTANKAITDEPDCDTILISPTFSNADQERLEKYIIKKQIDRLYSKSLPSVKELFLSAFWHEKIQAENPISVMEMLAEDFISRGYVSDNYLTSLLQRESILTFAFQPSVVLMYTLTPSSRTCLSVATLDHRIKWNSYKIRTVIMAAVRPEDTTVIFRLINELYYSGFNPNECRFMKTKEELMKFLKLT